MRRRTVLVVAAVLLSTGACVRLGFWQLSRLEEKRAINASRRAAAAAPPVRIGTRFPPAESLAWRTVLATGRYDETRQILLAGRSHEGEPGVEVVTPLVVGEGAAVLVDRGWLSAPDALTARPQDYPEPGVVEVLGRVAPATRTRSAFGVHALRDDSLILYATRGIDLDTMAARLPYRLAPFVLVQLPGPGVPDRPLRVAPHPLDESRHLGYAIQWFSFATILLAGSARLAWSRRPRGAPPQRVC